MEETKLFDDPHGLVNLSSEWEIKLLQEILKTLKAMKQQEFDYWEAWKKAKTAEQQNDEEVVS